MVKIFGRKIYIGTSEVTAVMTFKTVDLAQEFYKYIVQKD